MKKLLTVLLTVLIAFTTLTINVAADPVDTEQIVEEEKKEVQDENANADEGASKEEAPIEGDSEKKDKVETEYVAMAENVNIRKELTKAATTKTYKLASSIQEGNKYIIVFNENAMLDTDDDYPTFKFVDVGDGEVTLSILSEETEEEDLGAVELIAVKDGDYYNFKFSGSDKYLYNWGGSISINNSEPNTLAKFVVKNDGTLYDSDEHKVYSFNDYWSIDIYGGGIGNAYLYEEKKDEITYQVFFYDESGEEVADFNPVNVHGLDEEIKVPKIEISSENKLDGWVIYDYNGEQIGELGADDTSFKLSTACVDHDFSKDGPESGPIYAVYPQITNRITYKIYYVDVNGIIDNEKPITGEHLGDTYKIDSSRVEIPDGMELAYWELQNNAFQTLGTITGTTFVLADYHKTIEPFDDGKDAVYKLIPHLKTAEPGRYELVDYVTKGSKYIIVTSDQVGKALAMNYKFEASNVEIKKEHNGKPYINIADSSDVITFRSSDLETKKPFDTFQLQTISNTPKYLNVTNEEAHLSNEGQLLYVDGDDTVVKGYNLRAARGNVSYNDSEWIQPGKNYQKSYLFKKVEDHTHGEWTYSKSEDGKSIVATCNADGCTEKGGHKVAITLVAPETTVYADGKDNSVKIDNLDNFVKETGVKVGNPIYYQNNKTLRQAPRDAGKYTAKLTVNGITISIDYEIKKAKQPITKVIMNNYVYGDGVNNNSEVGKFAKPSFDGIVQENAKVKYYVQELGTREFDIKSFNNRSLNVKPNPYHLFVTIEETRNYEKLVLNDTFAVLPAEIALPVALDLTYNGKPQDGFSRNQLRDLYYRYGVTAGNYTETNAGTYDTTFKLANTNYYWQGQSDETRSVSVSWTIKALKVPTTNVSIDRDHFVYNGKDQHPNVTVMVNKYWKLKEDVDYTVTYDDDFDKAGSDIKNVGTKYARVVLSSNFVFENGRKLEEASSASAITYVDKKYYITPKTVHVHWDVKDYVYDGEKHSPNLVFDDETYSEDNIDYFQIDLRLGDLPEDKKFTEDELMAMIDEAQRANGADLYRFEDAGEYCSFALITGKTSNYHFVGTNEDDPWYDDVDPWIHRIAFTDFTIDQRELHIEWDSKTKFVKNGKPHVPTFEVVSATNDEEDDTAIVKRDVDAIYVDYIEGYGARTDKGNHTAKLAVFSNDERRNPSSNYVIKEGEDIKEFKIYVKSNEDTTPVKTGVDR